MNEPVFKTILGESWDKLGGVIQKHYFLRPYSEDYICVTGTMSEVRHSFIAKLFIPMGWLFGAIVPFQGKDIPIDVHYNSSNTNSNIYWDRVFKFSVKRHFHFKSHMVHCRENEVIEFVRFGVGLKLKVTAEDGALVFRDTGYIWRIFGINIPIPGRILIGRAYVEERPIDNNNFLMRMQVVHPVFGELFVYKGQFRVDVKTI